MSILLMAHAMDLDITAGQKSVLLVMANFANDDGENVYPSHDTIAKKTSLTRRTVITTVKQLTEFGYVKLEGRRGNRQNIYSLNVSKIMQMCNDFTGRCETISHNPLVEPLDNNIKELKIVDDTKFAQQKAQQYEMMKALAATCSRILADNRPILGRFAKNLLKLGYTPADVTAFTHYWYTYDWRGKMRQPPSPAQVVELIGISKSKMPAVPTQDEIDQAMSEITWNEEE